MLEIEMLANRVKQLKESLKLAQVDNAMLTLQMMKQNGVIKNQFDEMLKLKETLVRQAQELEYHEIADLERSWGK